MSETTLFVRKATGLVRAWSALDAFIYATFSINLITLGLFIFSFGIFVPGGDLAWAIIISSIIILLEVVVYASLISVMPRAGGDYVWQSRILGGGIGFVLAVTGWWFILWHWVPIYGDILVKEFFVPVLAILGAREAALWFTGSTGLFWSSMVVAAFVTFYIAIGMRNYARVQKICFWGGVVGLLIVLALLLFNNRAAFEAAFNSHASALFGAPGNAYQATLEASKASGYYDPDAGPGFGRLLLVPTILLIPMVVFFNLWPNWGATLYGEVKGAGDFRRNFYGMGLALVVTAILAVILLALVGKTMGWEFYNAANGAFWADVYEGTEAAPLGAVWPYPAMLAAFLVNNRAVQLIIVLLMSLWFWGWSGTVFLSSTRVVFAAAFDRLLPEWAADVSPRFRTPINALLLMLVPSIVVSALYAFTPWFSTLVLDATLVIAVTFAGSTVAAILLPYRKPDLFNASPIAQMKIAGLPMITVAGVLYLLFLGFLLWKWFTDATYGINNPQSLIYMGVLYLLAIVIYVVSKAMRRRQGIDLDMVYKEIPAE